MIPDYYQILGVPVDATFVAIKRAYRQKATIFHPDHGGSHTQMLAINEAFEILSNADTRRQYDFARSNLNNARAQEQAATTTQEARSRADNYPKAWSVFEEWLNSDFENAEYGSKPLWLFGATEMPTVAKSTSGAVFLVGGALLGVIICLLFFRASISLPDFAGSSKVVYLDLPQQLPRLVFFAVIGAWLGRYMHQSVGSFLVKSSKRNSTAPPTILQDIIECPNCTQKLRMPHIEKSIRITCSSCKHVFIHNLGV